MERVSGGTVLLNMLKKVCGSRFSRVKEVGLGEGVKAAELPEEAGAAVEPSLSINREKKKCSRTKLFLES